MQHVGPSTWHLLDHYSPTRYLSGALFKPRPGPWPSRLHRTSPLYRRGDFLAYIYLSLAEIQRITTVLLSC